MPNPYVSPLRTTIAASGTKYHYFPRADGGEQYCAPAHCRECWREANWMEGQTHGR